MDDEEMYVPTVQFFFPSLFSCGWIHFVTFPLFYCFSLFSELANWNFCCFYEADRRRRTIKCCPFLFPIIIIAKFPPFRFNALLLSSPPYLPFRTKANAAPAIRKYTDLLMTLFWPKIMYAKSNSNRIFLWSKISITVMQALA